MSQPFEVSDPPNDAISSVRFSPSGTRIAVASWSRTITVYQQSEDTSQPFKLQRRIQCRAPILDICWGADDSVIYAVGLDQDVRRVDLSEDGQDSQTVLSTHSSASNKVAYSKQHELVLSTSWDSTLHIHNTNPSDGAFIAVALKAKPFALALTEQRAVIAMAERFVSVYDIRALKMLTEQTDSTRSAPEEGGKEAIHVAPWQERESSLRFMTRAITTMPDGTGFVTSSIEGRVGVDWFDTENQAKAYAFKCHRQTTTAVGDDGVEQDVDMVYPVNAVAFHPVYGSFVTAGGDGVIAVWDAVQKRRLRLWQRLPASIAAVDFSPDGKRLAIGVSPGFEDGQDDTETDSSLVKLYVREITDGEMKGRSAK